MENTTKIPSVDALYPWSAAPNRSGVGYLPTSCNWSDVASSEVQANCSSVDDYGGNVSETMNCTNDYCMKDEDYWDLVYQHIYPKDYEWALIAMHSLVFVAGLVGNALVCLAVYRNHAMRTVTNYFIVNLAVADFMVILFCLPPTVVWDVTETWFMGTGLCKVVLYLQVMENQCDESGGPGEILNVSSAPDNAKARMRPTYTSEKCFM